MKMILAERYILKVPIAGGKGAYDTKGQKELVMPKTLLSEKYVEQRNAVKNNEHYITYPGETAELMKEREVNIELNRAKKKKQSMGIPDLIDAISLGGPKQPVQAQTEIEMLRAMCDKRGIKYHHKATEGTLLELLNAK